MAGAVEEVAKVATGTVSAMASQPLALALLVINIGFLGFAGYVLGEVAANASERNKTQMDLIARLVSDIRDCRQGPSHSAARNGMCFPPFKDAIGFSFWEPSASDLAK